MLTQFKQLFDIRVLWMVLLSGMLTSCKKPEAAAAGAPPAAVTTGSAELRDVPIYLDEIGNVAATESVTLRPQVDGRITSVNFVEGSDVKKGQVLYEIDPRPFKAVLAQVEAAVAQSKASRETAKAEFNRVEAVRNTAAISQSDYDTRKGELAVAEAQVLAAEANVETARLNLEYCTIKSPIDGRTGQRLIDAGNIVKENETDLVIIQRLDPVFVDFTVTEGNLPRVKQYLDQAQLQVQIFLPSEFEQQVKGGPATQPATPPTSQPATQPTSESPAQVMSQAIPRSSTQPATQPASQTAAQPTIQPGGQFERPIRLGKLVFIDNAVREGTGTIKVRASVLNTNRSLWPGQYVRVRVILTVKPDAVLIPARAIQVGQAGPFVYVVAGDAAEIRPVTLGQKHGDLTVVDSGISAADKLIITGQMTLFPGAKILDVGAMQAGAPGMSSPPADAAAPNNAEPDNSGKNTEGASS